MGRVRTCKSSARHIFERGSVFIETALVIVPTLLIALGTIDYAAYMEELRVLSEASYIGTMAATKLERQLPSGSVTAETKVRQAVEDAVATFLNNMGYKYSSANYALRITDEVFNYATPPTPLYGVRVVIGRNAASAANWIEFLPFLKHQNSCPSSLVLLRNGNRVEPRLDDIPGC